MSKADEKRWLRLARGVLSRPTAPFLEQAPAEHVRAFARERGLKLEEDRFGNLLVKYPGRGSRKSPPLVLVAHLDHPGFVVDRVEGEVAHLTFRGGVRRKHAKIGTKLDFYREGRNSPIGSGKLRSTSSRGGRRPGSLTGGTATITKGRAAAGGFTMWSFPAYRESGGRIVSRCCDDLMGVAAALATLDEMARRRPRGAHVWGWFTRAEEVGLFGAIAGVAGRVVPKDAWLLSLETSRALPHAPQGGGVIVRVGDAMSLFDPQVMGAMHQAAKELSQEDPSFTYQRRLMDGGGCEASAFCAAGYRAGGVALPLGNYHNMAGLDGGEAGIGPESVRTSDYLDEVKLLTRLGEHSGDLAALGDATRAWFAPALEKSRAALLAAPLGPPKRRRR